MKHYYTFKITIPKFQGRFRLRALVLLAFTLLGSGGHLMAQKQSATDSVIINRTNTSARDWGRGFEFKPNKHMVVTDIGARVLVKDTFPMVLWDVANQKELVKFVFKPTSAGVYEYVKLSSPIYLEKGKNYALTMYGDQVGYYFDNSSQANKDIEYITMRYCGGCSKSQSFPTNGLGGYHYGTPDFLFLPASMIVHSNGNSISNGSTVSDTSNNTSFDSVSTKLFLEKDFYASNVVTAFEDTIPLTGSPKVTISGTNASDFTVVQQISADTLFGGDSSLFKIRFTPSDTATREATVSIAYTDSLRGNSTYTFKISGIGYKPPYNLSLSIDSNVSCNGLKDGKATATIVGGVAPLRRAWMHGDTTLTATGLAAGKYYFMVIDATKDTLIDSVTITEPTTLVAATVVDNNISCNGFSDGKATASATGGTTPYTYAWSNAATTAIVASLSVGTYTATITDANGCTATSSSTLTEPSKLLGSATVTKHAATSGSGSASASASGGTSPYTYLWSNASTSSTNSSLSAGTYTVTITDNNGCTVSSSAIILNSFKLSVNLDSNATCASSKDARVTATATQGTKPYTYAWSGSSSTDSFLSKLGVGKYYLTVTDANSITMSDSIEVTGPAALSALSTSGGVQTSKTLASDYGGWLDNSTGIVESSTSTFVFAGQLGTDHIGWLRFDISSLPTGAKVDSIVLDLYCNGVGGATNEKLDINSANDVIGPFGSPNTTAFADFGNGLYANVDVTGSGTYSNIKLGGTASKDLEKQLSNGKFQIAIDANNTPNWKRFSTSLSKIKIYYNEAPSKEESLCFGSMGDTVDVFDTASGGSGNYGYFWEVSRDLGSSYAAAGGTNNTMHYIPTEKLYDTTYYRRGVADLTCGDTVYNDPAKYYVADSLHATLVVDSHAYSNTTNDGGISATAQGGVAPYTYLWSNSGTASTLTNLGVGNYTLTLTDAVGCSFIDSLEVRLRLRVTANVDTNVYCNGGSNGDASVAILSGNGPYSYSWSNAATDSFISNTTAGTYTVTVTDGNNSVASSTITITEPTAVVAGTISGDTTICAGKAPNAIKSTTIASGGAGTHAYQWQMSTDSTQWSNISGATLSTYQPGNISMNTWFRRMATDANQCGPFPSNAVKVGTFAQPSAGFKATAACEGEQTQFTDTTVLAFGKIQSYSWSFGDQGTSNQQNPINIYKNSGSYNVTLAIVSDGGCKSTVTRTVSVNDMPTVDFSSTTECKGTATAFTNKSSLGTGSMTHSWNLGDNNSSTSTSPSHTYTNSGYYAVSLTSTTDKGCVDSTSKTVQVKQVAKPNFSATSVCEGGTTAFTNLSTNGSSYSWDFGDNGNGSKRANPKNKYKSSGGYTVVLTATSADGCSDTAQRLVNVYALPTAAFSANEVCLGATTSFTNTSTGASSYQWIFGNATSSNNATPSLVYGQAGNYTVELTATTANGCVASAKNTVTVNALPKVAFTTADVCQSDALRTTNTTTGANTYAWTFGDGGTSATLAPTHNYTNPGRYQVQLVATSSKGCVDSSATSINAHAEPQVSFTANNVCFGNNNQFSNTSSIANGTMTYVWDLGNGSTTGNPSPSYAYGSAGTYSIKLVATSNQGCKDSTTGSVDVYAQPTASFTGANVCYGDTFRTSNLSTGAATYAWSFGDRTTSTSTAPNNFYGKSGNYEVKLIATTSNNCIDSASQVISIYAKPIADFDVADVCDEEKVQFTNTSYDAIIASNNWDFGDGKTDKKANPEHVYGSANSYTATLIAISNEGCSDTTAQTVTVHPNPVMAFSASTECDYDATVFTNTSNIGSGTINYTWDFGTGDTAQSQSPSYQFASAGSYKVNLVGMSDKGCSAQTANTITVHPSPLASMLLADNCEEDPSTFESTSSISKGAINTYTWDLGDGNAINGKKPTHLYAADGVYAIELIVMSNNGCVDTATQSMEVYAKPVADFTVADVCFKATSLFTNTSVDGQDYLYDFGDKWGISTLGSPEYTYEAPGTYSATLYATSDKGCKDTVTKSLTIYSLPVADFTVNNHCFGEAFEPKDASTGNPSNWNWDYADGNTGTDANPTHNYGKDGDYNVQLTVTDDNNCIDSFRKTVTVWPLPVVGIRTDTLVSKGYTVPMSATGGVEYKWSPVDNLDRPLTANPTATVVEDVTYTVTVANRFGCTRDTFANLKVREDYTLEPSNIITPDGNGQNDNWVVEKAQYYSDVEVIVFDRWGRIVYTNTAYDNSWNGTSTTGEPLPDGAYYYVVKVPTDREEYKGSITVFR